MAKTIVIQNVDRIAKPVHYSSLAADELLVTSFFRTIQGEGPYSGYPSIFLRLAGCNFGNKVDRCPWCDTSFQFDNGKVFNTESLLKVLTDLPGYTKTDVLVITGGEPMLQANLVEFIGAAKDLFADVQIETNGTQSAFFNKLAAQAWYRIRGFPMLIVSPKASYKADRYPELSSVALQAAHSLKFVVDANPESPHHEVPAWAFEAKRLHGYQLYVSPMARYARPYEGEVSSIWDEDLIDRESTAANYAYAAQYAMRHNVLLSLQTHLFLAVP